MNVNAILEAIWQVLNSPVGIAAIAALVLWLLNRLYTAKPAWAKYEGAIIAGIKHAEKMVPDDTDNKSLARLDAALKYVLKVYAEVNKRTPSTKEIAELKDGISIVHNELVAEGTLK